MLGSICGVSSQRASRYIGTDVTLFQNCSLSSATKRRVAEFETPDPVFVHLHGIYEGVPTRQTDDDLAMPTERGHFSAETNNMRSSSRTTMKTQPLRQWLANHLNRPYPSETDKEMQVCASGLSKSQVLNWSSNARRRQRDIGELGRFRARKTFGDGSPMPRVAAPWDVRLYQDGGIVLRKMRLDP